MDDQDKGQSRYYQTIAREFFRRRGAPFFLSPKDLALVARWEAMSIPLEIILEGMERSFESDSRKKRRREKVLSLAFCAAQVEMAFEQYRERKVGHKKTPTGCGGKRDQLKKEIQGFLSRLPESLCDLKPWYSLALEILSLPEIDEDRLEKMDREVDELLFHLVPGADRERLGREVSREFPGVKSGDMVEILRTTLIKGQRDKFKVPYLSLFYY